MSVAELPAHSLLGQNLHGVVRGKTIELESDPHLPDGQLVSVVLRSIPENSEVGDDVVAFARAHGVEGHLYRILAMTAEAFPRARRIATRLDEDAECVDDRHIVVQVHAVDLNVDQGVVADRQWHERLLQTCPKRLAWVFRLGLERAT